MRRRGKPFALVATAAGVLAIQPLAGHSLPAAQAEVVPSRALVLLERPPRARTASAVSASARALVARHGLRRARPDVPEVGLLTASVPPRTRFERFARRLRRDPAVRSVERELRHETRLVPSDPALVDSDPSASSPTAYQWYLAQEGFPSAWDYSRGTGVTVGIIDSGLDATHPEFAGKVVAVHDRDARSTGSGDQVGHGTHVSGLACAATNNAAGIAGGGFDCRVVMEKSDLTSSSVVASLVGATRSGAKVINMSFGGTRLTLPEVLALRYAFRRDVVLVAAAADSPTVEQGHPAKDLQPRGTGPRLNAGNGLVVTAADATGARAAFAGRGSQISMAAYGDTGVGGPPGIFSTFPGNPTEIETGSMRPPSPPCANCRTTFRGDNRYGYLSGTSMAAPQVTAAVALVRAAAPRLRNLSVIRLMKVTARRGQSGWSTETGWGILDAGAAVRGALALAADTVPPATRPRGGRKRRAGRRFTLRWSGRDRAPAGVVPAGIEVYRIYARRGTRGRYRRVATVRRPLVHFRGRRGARYSFYVQGRDRAGNLERPPRGADFLVRIRK